MVNRLKNQQAVITGGSDGLGLAIAYAFAAEGADLWLVARNREKLALAAESLKSEGGKVRFTAVDLTDPKAAEQVQTRIRASNAERCHDCRHTIFHVALRA